MLYDFKKKRKNKDTEKKKKSLMVKNAKCPTQHTK